MGDIPMMGQFEIHDVNGKVIGFISAHELAELREENEVLQRQLQSLLPVATDEEEGEMAALLATSVDLNMGEIIQELRASGGLA